MIIRLMPVRGTLNPWITSRLVSLKVTVEPAGMRISGGSNTQARATMTASYSSGPTCRRPGWSKGAVVATWVGWICPTSVSTWIPSPKAL